MAMMGSKQIYKNSPRLTRGEDGKMGVAPRAEPAEQSGVNEPDEGMGGMPVQEAHASERREMKHRHVAEHLAAHNRHEQHHALHKGKKDNLHKRHEEEMKQLHQKHEKEVLDMHSRHESDNGEGRADMMEKGKNE